MIFASLEVFALPRSLPSRTCVSFCSPSRTFSCLDCDMLLERRDSALEMGQEELRDGRTSR